jgi:hypothetical protein
MPQSYHGNTIIPFEFVTGLKPDLSQLRISTSKCYKLQFTETRVDKLANRSEQCLYVGHSDGNVRTFLFYH